MKAIIPVAGAGTRLRPHTYVLPKVLINVGGKPILSHIIEKAIESGIDNIAFIIGYKGELIRTFVKNNYSIDFTFYNQEHMLGLAHAVGLAEDYLINEPVFIILGDTIFDVDLESVFQSGYSTLGVKEVKDPRRFGTAETDASGFITKLIEKPDKALSNLALVGLYYIQNGVVLKECIKEVIDSNKLTRGEFQITDALQFMIERGEKIKTFKVDGWYDCGKPETILSTNQYLLSKSSKKFHVKGSLIRPPVYIDSSAKIDNSIIGPHTTIAKGAIITNSILINSIIGEESQVADINLEDSIIGSRAIISGSFKSLNISDYSDISL